MKRRAAGGEEDLCKVVLVLAGSRSFTLSLSLFLSLYLLLLYYST